jgi:hypothetical protein
MLLVLEFCLGPPSYSESPQPNKECRSTSHIYRQVQTITNPWENMENSQDSSLCRLLLSANDNLAERPGLRLHAIALQGMFRQRVIVVYCVRGA